MIVLNPGTVRFGSFVWEDVLVVAADRVATRVIEEHDDLGPFAAFVDLAEQSVYVRVQRSIAADDVEAPALGTAGTLVVFAAPPADDRRRRRVKISCVVVGIKAEVGTGGSGGRGPTQTILFRGVAGAGGTDPVVIETPALTEA
jgi:hypothetical protein